MSIDAENAHNIQQFLRLRRLPFLTLVSLPAIFPLLFPTSPGSPRWGDRTSCRSRMWAGAGWPG